MDELTWSIQKEPDPHDVRFLDDQLYAYNVACTQVDNGRLISIILRDNSGEIAAGLYGWTWGACLYVDKLWVREDQRRAGYGSRLLQAAEREGVVRGCTQALLVTHSFQAPDFYRKQGYEIVGAFEGYPTTGHQQFFLRKALV